METFAYRGFDGNGRRSKGLVEASSAKDAREKLSVDGVLVDRLSVVSGGCSFSEEERSVVYLELGSLLAAGLPLIKALEVMIASPEMKRVSGVLASARDRVTEGATLAEALRQSSSHVTLFEQAIVQTSERVGDSAGMLKRLSECMEEDIRLKDRVRSVLAYPAVVAIGGICVAALMLGLLLPKACAMLGNSDVALPLITRIMLAVGVFVRRWGVACSVILVGAVFLLVYRLRTDSKVRMGWERWLFGLPVIGRGYGMLAALRFSRTFAILIEGGVSLVDGLVLAGSSTGSKWIAFKAEAGAEAIRNGCRLSEAVREIPPLAASLPGWIEVGEAGGGLSDLLTSASERYQNQWNRFVERGLRLLEPILIVAIGGFVLLVALSVLLPVLSLSQHLN